MPVRARVTGDVAVAKKGKERVVDEKPMTHRNSARVSCANRGVDTEFSSPCQGHTQQARKGPLDGADPPSFSARVVDPMQSS